MRIPRRGNIRSHRAKKRKIFAPWIVVTTVTVLVMATLSTGFYFLVKSSCTGNITATIVAAPSAATLLESAARGWSGEQPSVNGRCARIDIETRDSGTTLEALGGQWNTKANGAAPDAWVPESTVWVSRALLNPEITRIIPKQRPSLARSVAVVAMPRPMAERLGWPKAKLTWQSLITDVAASPNGWARYDKPDWGQIRIGISEPTTSTAGLLALASIAGADKSGQPSDAGLAAITRLKQTRTVLAPSIEHILSELSKADLQGTEGGLQYLSAFPALETDVLTYNQGNPAVPLAAVYPDDGSADADHPYLVLNAAWSDPDRKQVVSEFLTYAQGKKARDGYLSAGFRDARRTAGGDLTTDNGLLAKVPKPARPALAQDGLEKVLATWTS